MKKLPFLVLLLFLLNSCAESMLYLALGASNGKIVQSSLNSAISYGVKKQTGKTPLEHAIAYAEEKILRKKQDTCISFIERTRSEFCAVVKKQISLKNTELVKKTSNMIQKLPKKNKIKEISLIESIAKKSVIYNRR